MLGGPPPGQLCTQRAPSTPPSGPRGALPEGRARRADRQSPEPRLSPGLHPSHQGQERRCPCNPGPSLPTSPWRGPVQAAAGLGDTDRSALTGRGVPDCRRQGAKPPHRPQVSAPAQAPGPHYLPHPPRLPFPLLPETQRVPHRTALWFSLRLSLPFLHGAMTFPSTVHMSFSKSRALKTGHRSGAGSTARMREPGPPAPPALLTLSGSASEPASPLLLPPHDPRERGCGPLSWGGAN